MKTVSEAVMSSKPVSLSKAAKILSKFALADNGASPAFVAYLKRASDSFDELVQLNKELRGSVSEQKSKKYRYGGHNIEEPLSSVRNCDEDESRENGVAMRKKKRAGRDEKQDGVVLDNRRDERKDQKKKKKLRDNGVVKMEEQSTQGTSNLETTGNTVEGIKRKKELRKIL